ncbi:hypothetical protein MBLNU459_g7560t1 [Dothideomycetes sp. NU459]
MSCIDILYVEVAIYSSGKLKASKQHTACYYLISATRNCSAIELKHTKQQSTQCLPLSVAFGFCEPAKLSFYKHRLLELLCQIPAPEQQPFQQPFGSYSSSSALPLSTSSSSVQSSSSSSSASSSFVAPEAYVVITSSSLQPWCSAYLGYTVPIATVTELYTNTQSTVQTSVSTEIDYSTSISTSTEVDVSTFTASVTITTGVPTGGSQSKRDDLMRPSALMPYPESAILSGCNKAVTSPATSTLYASTTATTVQTSIFSTATTTISTVISSTVTTQVTSKTLTMTSTVLTSAIPVQTQFVSNPSFEIGNGPSNLTSWTSYGSGADLSTTAANAYDGNQAL